MDATESDEERTERAVRRADVLQRAVAMYWRAVVFFAFAFVDGVITLAVKDQHPLAGRFFAAAMAVALLMGGYLIFRAKQMEGSAE